MKNKTLYALAAGIFIAGGFLYAARGVGSFDGPLPPPGSKVLSTSHVGIPNIALTTHEGRKVRFYDDLVKDKMVLITFMYTTCDGI